MTDKDNAENYTERALKNFQYSIFLSNNDSFRVAVIFQCHFQRQIVKVYTSVCRFPYVVV